MNAQEGVWSACRISPALPVTDSFPFVLVQITKKASG